LFAHLPLYAGAEGRHLFFDHRDAPGVFPAGSFSLKPSVHRRDLGPRVHCIPYLDVVDNFMSYLHRPVAVRYPLSFAGQRTELRERLLPRIGAAVPGCWFRLRETFFHGPLMTHPGVVRPAPLSDPALERRWRLEFISTLLHSRMALSLPGYGLNAFRFYEALSLGVPVLQVGDDCALPWEDVVDYPAFSRCVPLHPEETLPERVAAALADVTDERLGEMRRMARLWYDAYLSPRNFFFLLYRALAPALGKHAGVLAGPAPEVPA
ncbi:MAG TPA: hypothetical protein VFJ16_22450, partial [Longimicrobium sp.]|nr:hypothetical protein [Longimicrobium sp.]